MMGEELETGEGWRRIGDGQVIRKCERQASDEGEQEAGEWWGRARDRRMMGKGDRQATNLVCQGPANVRYVDCLAGIVGCV